MTGDNGGSTITEFELHYDTIQATANYQQIWSGSAYQVTLDNSVLVTGTTYRFILYARNKFGLGPASEVTRVALGSLPAQPTGLLKVESSSSRTSIQVTWDKTPDTDGIQVDGYMLYVDDGLSGNFNSIYDGTGDPHTLTYLATGLTTGLPYRFKVRAININGSGPDSDITTIYACLLPSGLLAPTRLTASKTSITI